MVVVLGLVSVRPGYGQISPGPLARAHESLGGPLNCTKCHEVGAGRQLKCLTCHTEIRQRLTDRRGMHAVWAASDQNGQTCATCHSDHNGADFPLVRWQPSRERLNHTQTGFALTGKHVGVACASCHQAAKIPAGARAPIQVKDLNHTFLGLSRDCASCHADEHRGQLGAACTRCHTTDGWKPAPGFNHAAGKFALTGAHATVDCAKCHSNASGAKPYTVYTGLAFAKCSSCHADPHKGSLAGACQSCHTTTSWGRAVRVTGFDHAKTAFTLDGKHRDLACSACHRRGNFSLPVAHARCADCHQDTHRGQFVARADHGECASCHTVTGFKPSTFDIKAHASTAYPLVGRHAAVACAACHQPKGKDTVFAIASTQCASCHEDVHKGQFAAAPHQNRCEDCHNVQGFAPAVFTVVRHRDTRFPLTGAHLAVPCADCHTATTKGVRDARAAPAPAAVSSSPVAPVKYVFGDRTCTACHEDPHRGEFRERMPAVRAGGSPADCTSCHDTARWTQLARFDHSTSRFQLTGAHRGVACLDCHRSRTLQPTLRNMDFRDAPKECAGCHEDPHADQFAARTDVKGCASCHRAAQWKPADFDHDTRTPFPLIGAHRTVACSGCHTRTRPQNGKVALVYAPTPRECKACHG